MNKILLKNIALFSSLFLTFNLIAKERKLDMLVFQAKKALIQGESQLAKKLISNEKKPSYNLLKLKILYYLERDNIDKAERSLNEFELQYFNVADTYAFTSEVWRSIGHKVSIFSKSYYYKKAVKAKITAGNKAPNDPKYLTMKASALGQSSQYGGNSSLQEQLAQKIKALDKKWGLIAEVNLAQNEDNLEQASKLAIQATKLFPQDFDVLNRTAKLFWTRSNYPSAQHYFYQACTSKSGDQWHSKINWINACSQTAIFAIEKNVNKDKGKKAIINLLREYQLPTNINFEYIKMYFKLSHTVSDPIIYKVLQNIVEKNSDVRLIKEAKGLLNKMSLNQPR
ncbi:hypothetical protein [Thalassotalea sp. PP2-459]|uniref:hypothetical protein n=1 Tax=Thalassotalea sp. PP2-459 TaxID=1742724 RepID=UPI000943E35C|nr:hypothetical protein [Thalassotalea sp. PP2-459]OKY27075.1 hypothetical protein BI291_10615 [Thalassotalea sp. PP2-459]